MKPSDFKHVSYLWDDAKAPTDPVELLVYRSNCLGSDQRVTNTGGGNTSNKIAEHDPLTGEAVDVLWVKGSGGDLRTSKRANFSSLYQDKLRSLKPKFGDGEPKSQEEDAMVGMYPHCTFNLNPRPSSIDTPLHAFIPHKYVDHMHPNAVIAIAACKDQERLNQEVFGGQLAYVGWQRPGFDLGLKMERIAEENPNAVGILMGQHGLINWSDESDKACYELTLSLIEKAAQYLADHDKGDQTFGGQKYRSLDDGKRNEVLHEILPWLRGQVSQQKRFIGTVEHRESVMTFVNSHDAQRLAEIGTSCPDHFLRTKIKPLYVDWDPASGTDKLRELLASGLERYRKDYADYYESCKRPDSPAMRDPNPTVILIPGVGMIAWGKNKSESRVTAEFYCCAVEVMRGAEAVSEYQGLPRQEAFDIEYWSLEEAKLQRMPPEKELARQVCVVIGGGSGIGKETCHRLVREGAEIVAVDLNEQAATGTAAEIEAQLGKGIGVAGSGISGCGDVIGLSADITDAESCRSMLEHVLLAYGGVDQVLVTAGYFATPDKQGVNTPEQWDRSFKINVTGLYNAADTAHTILKAQGLGGGIVLTTSVNAVVAKKGSFPYDTSKAAANHLVRELAVAYAPDVRVNGVAPATVVAGSSMFPKDRVMASLSKYEIDYDENADEETLRNQLAEFYAKRTLTHRPIRPIDQAEAIFLLASDRLSRTTGQILTVDGGLHEAFLR
ncbi:MAG: bifunctional rhamnulose-1-phosphate aldolase/short-chain dehydrogenase [Planctomycetota bacterium]